MKIIDLSQTISEDMMVFPGASRPMITKIADVDTDFYLEHKITLTTHIATHIDAPAHIIKDGERLIDLDISQYIGNGYVLDVTGCKEISVDVLKQINKFSQIDFLLFYTGLGELFGSTDYMKAFPVLTPEACNYIIHYGSNMKGIGVDCFSIDTVEPLSIQNHIPILGSGLIIIENLRNLKVLINKTFMLSVLPLKAQCIEGSPVRAIAIIEED